MLNTYDTTGVLVHGELTIRNKQQFQAALRTMGNGEVIVSVRRARATRSPEQNRLYWKCYVTPLAAYTGYSALWMHSYLKQRLLVAPEIVITDRDEHLIDEALLVPTTTTLTKIEFSDYLHGIEEFAERLDVTVGAPIEEPR